MSGPTRPSLPSEPSLRRLGVGGGGGGERPLRAQLVVALVVGLVLLAVPLYLWRRPSGTENALKDGGAADARNDAPIAASGSPLELDAGAAEERVKLGLPQRVRCGASSKGGREGTLCDGLPVFEAALSKAIRENVDCAPKLQKEGSINYVLNVDFVGQKLHVFPGASGSWKGPVARKAAACIKRALPAPDWSNIQHQHRYYSIAVMATYPTAPKAAAPASTAIPSADAGPPPLFE